MGKDRYLKQLLDVIRVLRGPEAELAKKHLTAYETNHTVNYQKMFKLYKYIKINQIENYEKLKHKISPDSTDDSFDKLIRRTTDRIQESLIIDVNIKRKNAYSDLFRNKFQMNKHIIQGQILMGRGLKDSSLHLFNKVIKSSQKYELYDELIEALSYKQVLLANIEGVKAFNLIEQEIEFYEKCRFYLKKVKKLQNLYQLESFGKSSEVGATKKFKEEVDNIKKYYHETSSVNILSYYYLLKIDIEKREVNYYKMSQLLRDLIKLLEDSVAIYSKTRISYLYRELATTENIQLNFKNALKVVVESKRLVSRTSLTSIINKIIEHNSLFFLEEYSVGIKKVDVALNQSNIRSFSYHYAIFKYQQALFLFALSEYKKSFTILSDKNEIEKDKEGWNVWIRIMRLLCSIELLKLDMIDYDVESFRKYLQRINKKYEVRERDKLILTVLLELDRQSYDFQQTAIEKKKELTLLQSTDKKYKWNPDSPELILFHDWFESKRLKKTYTPNFEVYRK